LLASLLLEESKKHMVGDPQKAYELVETAETVLRCTREVPGVADLSVRAAAYRANLYRLSGSPREARKQFEYGRDIMRSHGVTDPLICAEVDSCEAVLDMEQRQLRRAEELLTSAIALYVLSGAHEQTVHPLVTLGLMHYHQGDYSKAIECTQAAIYAIPPERDRRLYLSARYNLSLYLSRLIHSPPRKGLNGGSSRSRPRVNRPSEGERKKIPRTYTSVTPLAAFSES
jgi:tetratricopeptide (TPR) repeat protein